VGEMVTFSSSGDIDEGYLALPESGSGPGVVVIQEWWGLVDHIKDVVDRCAAEGFVALAPDFFHGITTSEPDEAARLMMGLAMDRAGQDIAGAASYLTHRAEVSGTGIGVVGFCAGGSLALWSATISPDVTTAVGFYPAIPWEKMSPSWGSYAAKSAMIHCSEEDGTSMADGIQLARQGIEEAGGAVQLYDYPETQHAFFNDDRPEVYHVEAAQLAWQRTLNLLHSRLSPSPG